MRLPLFFPAAFAIIGAMIWYAIEPGLENLEQITYIRTVIAEQGYTVRGDALEEAVVGPRAQSELFGPPSLRRAVMSSHGGPDETTSSHGVLFAAPPFALSAFSGQTIDVKLSVRSARENGSQRALLRFDIQNTGTSGWREIEIGEEFREVGFSFDVPETTSSDLVFVLIWPDADGDGGQIEVREVILRPVS